MEKPTYKELELEMWAKSSFGCGPYGKDIESWWNDVGPHWWVGTEEFVLVAWEVLKNECRGY